MGSTKSVRPLRSVRELSTSRRASWPMIVWPMPRWTLLPLIRAVPVNRRSPVPSTVPPDWRKSLRAKKSVPEVPWKFAVPAWRWKPPLTRAPTSKVWLVELERR